MVRIHQSAPNFLYIMKKKFLKFCLENKFQQNEKQLKVLDSLIKFYKNKNILKKILSKFFKSEKKLGFYLQGEVGVGKTMLLNFFFDNLEAHKQRKHFNEFMIEFHDFRHDYKLKGKNNSINIFVKNLKQKVNLIYLDEFQVTNIVDAMILGKLFEAIFKENIKVLISSNIKINDLYKEGLQREQFIPFINIISKFCVEHELVINHDYRKFGISKLERFFYPINNKTFFQVSSVFREISKKKINKPKKVIIKGRDFVIQFYFEGCARFDFNDLCGVSIGAEDYIKIAELCNFMLIEGVPNFDDENADKQQRFITLIDILYEKKIPIMLTANFNYKNFKSSRRLVDPYKRTISRLFELTSPKFKIN
jgi:cell division protein ZapE